MRKAVESRDGWTLEMASDVKLPQWWAVWGAEQGIGRDSFPSRGSQRDLINSYRARHGMAPLKPRKE